MITRQGNFSVVVKCLVFQGSVGHSINVVIHEHSRMKITPTLLDINAQCLNGHSICTQELNDFFALS